jgi:hypothetical protein
MAVLEQCLRLARLMKTSPYATYIQLPESAINRVLQLLQTPFWKRVEFWIAVTIGIAGLVFSILAFIEARKAKRAATEAGRTLKLQTVTIELTEVAQRLDRIQPNIQFNEARDLLSEISRRLRRATSPFANDPALSTAINAVREALEAAKTSLKSVRPTDLAKEAETPNAVYYAIEEDFATITNFLADLLGLFEKITLHFGDDDAES